MVEEMLVDAARRASNLLVAEVIALHKLIETKDIGINEQVTLTDMMEKKIKIALGLDEYFR